MTIFSKVLLLFIGIIFFLVVVILFPLIIFFTPVIILVLFFVYFKTVKPYQNAKKYGKHISVKVEKIDCSHHIKEPPQYIRKAIWALPFIMGSIAYIILSAPALTATKRAGIAFFIVVVSVFVTIKISFFDLKKEQKKLKRSQRYACKLHVKHNGTLYFSDTIAGKYLVHIKAGDTVDAWYVDDHTLYLMHRGKVLLSGLLKSKHPSL